MGSDWLVNYAIAFVATIVLEVVVALLLGYRRRVEIVCVLLVNVFSHPLVNYLIWVVNTLRAEPLGPLGHLPFEIGVVLVEWLLLCFALPRHNRSRLFVLSLAMNSVSYLAGVLVFFLAMRQPF
jgi:hypothetical protein